MSPARAFGVAVVLTVCGAKSAAAETITPMQEAVSSFEQAEASLQLTTPCENMCKALQSMIHAAERICELAKDGSPLDQKRCVDAKAKVNDAITRVRAACPDCVKPEGAPTVAAKPPAPPAAPSKSEAAYGGVADAEYVAARGRTTSLELDLLPLALPPTVFQPRFVRRVGERMALAITFGFGVLPKTDGRENGRTGVLVAGGELRMTMLGAFDGLSAFAGLDFAYRSGDLELGEHLTARSFPLGFAVGPELGLRFVTPYGLTVEARAGVDFLVQDLRGQGAPTDKVLPLGAVSAGWSF